MNKNSRRKFIKDLGFISAGTFILPNLKFTADNTAHAKIIILGGIASCAGLTYNGWYSASLVISDEHRHSVSDSDIDSNLSFEARGNLLQKWLAEQHLDCSAKLILTTSYHTSANKELVCEKSIFPPVSPREKTASPVVVFVSRDKNKWHLNLYRNDVLSRLLSSDTSIRYPSVISVKDDIIISYEKDNGSDGLISLINKQGEIIYQTRGRRAKLVNADDNIILMKEICTNNSIITSIELVKEKRKEKIWNLPGEDDYTFNGDICYYKGKLYVVAETTHAFGQDDRLGNFRKLRAWKVSLSDKSIRPMAEQSLIPIPEQTSTWMKENLSPIRPIIFIEKGIPVVFYRQFRDAGFKHFGWDLFKTGLKGGKWNQPIRISENIISPDTSLGIVQQGDSYLLAMPSFDYGPQIDGGPVVPVNHRIEIINQNRTKEFPYIIGKGTHRFKFEESIGYKNIAQKPPELSCETDNRFLIWGDLHMHSTYSKCIASMNGMPDEMFRYQRDVLQNEVLCSLEHSHFMKGSEQKYVYDILEAESSNNHIVIYGDEPGIKQGRHTNFYSYKRDVIEKLRNIIILFDRSNRSQIYKAIKTFIEKDDLLVTRHFHGNMYPSEKEMLDSFDAELEWVFEAMQGRTNAMMENNFPNCFLNGGKKVGLYGGTDHYRGVGPNHYCLTGFWVKEFSPEGVWEALKSRKTIAVSNAKIAMFATLNNKLFGEEMTVQQSDMIFKVNLSSVHPVKRLGLMRDGEMLGWISVNDTMVQTELTDTNVAKGYHWYCVTAEAESVYEETALGHISPFFVTVI